MSRHVQAAGGVLWRERDGAVEVALVHRPRYDDWSLPKGKLDPGELAVTGGLREVREETGFTAVAGRTLGQSRYRVLDHGRDASKTVRWWALRAVGGQFVPGSEVDGLQWHTVSSALERVTAGRDVAPLQAFAAHPARTTTVLLLRHGSAGDRELWAGEDDLRPLDDIGQAQATAAADVLQAYAPTAVTSAPPLRCTATVQPLADRLGVGLGVDPALSEAGWAEDPRRALAAVCALGSGGRVVAACSQGGAVQGVVGALTTQAGLEPDRVRARKGSLWALSFADGLLVDADYTPDLRG